MDAGADFVMPTRGELGVGYLTGVGFALIASLAGYVWYTRESFLVVFVGVLVAIVLFSTIAYIGYLFLTIGLSGRYVWTVARWSAGGLGVAVLFCAGITASTAYFPDSRLVPSLLVLTIPTFGVIGTLVGVITGLREQHQRLDEATQRNAVMNRVLRHNIKNSMSVVDGHASLLAEGADDEAARSLAAIRRAVDEVVSLSETARNIDALDADVGTEPIELVSVVERVVENARETYPGVVITTAFPPVAWADAGPLLRSALVNLVENAVEHNDGEAEIHVSVETDDDARDTVTLSVADNGPGISESEREVLFTGAEAPTRHGNGLGLWLVKWVVDHFEGDLRFDANEPRGTVVTLELPAAEPPIQAAGAPVR